MDGAGTIGWGAASVVDCLAPAACVSVCMEGIEWLGLEYLTNTRVGRSMGSDRLHAPCHFQCRHGDRAGHQLIDTISPVGNSSVDRCYHCCSCCCSDGHCMMCRET